jgi:UDP-N-acetylmuramoyl-tripeptide--D-alanyl-D-alanine ligase
MRHKIYLWLATKLYFPVSRYFRFFAAIVISRWQPKIVAVIGSAGKSNAHNLLFRVISTKYSVRKSQKANSAFAIPLDVLRIHIHRYTPSEWLLAALKVPFHALLLFLFPPKERYYICELDVDRPGEMAFFASFIKPSYIFWVSSYATHTANFDRLVEKKLYEDAAMAVAAEFAKLFSGGRKIVGLLNGDSKYIAKALQNYRFNRFDLKDSVGKYCFSNWQIFRKRTVYKLKVGKETTEVELPIIAPRNFGYTVLAAYILANKLGVSTAGWQKAVSEFQLNPGICSLLDGLGGSKIIDSSYNSSLYATKSLLEVLAKYPGRRKIAVLGDMRELGMSSSGQHRELGEVLLGHSFDQVVLVGPETGKYVLPLLKKHYQETCVHWFENSYQAGLFIKERLLKAGDVILLKASQNTLFFEIIAELLLAEPTDKDKLCRREPVWEKKRLLIKDDFYKLLA